MPYVDAIPKQVTVLEINTHVNLVATTTLDTFEVYSLAIFTNNAEDEIAAFTFSHYNVFVLSI